MSGRAVLNVFTLVVMSMAATSIAADGVDAPQGVSPGAWDRLAVIDADCPTFSWEVVSDTSYYELVAYRLPEAFTIEDGLDLKAATEVLYTRISGGAASWTPDASERFAPGGSYAWFVRAVIDPESGDGTGWSAPRLFAVSEAPSVEEVSDALGVLQRYIAQNPDGVRELGTLFSGDRRAASTAPTRLPRPATLSPKASFTGKTAIMAVQPDATGETYGVYGVTSSETDGSAGVLGEATAATGEIYGVGGVTASVEGAGVVAFNTANGADLLLGDESSSAALTESGLDRPSPGPVVFEFTNSEAAGTMTLQVDGTDVVTTLTDRDTLDGLGCGVGEIPKWNGTFWYCSPDEDTTYSNGNQLGLAGTTFNVLEGAGSGLDADTLDGHNTDYFATAAHGHFGAIWSGSATDGLKVDNTSSGTSFAIKGWATGASGGTFGVFGKSNSTGGTGVWGWADAATGETTGVSGLSSSDAGTGVLAEASSSTGTTYGVHGTSGSADGYAGYFENTNGGIDIMAGGSGDVVQTLAGNGLVKAAAYFFCDNEPEVYRYFNNVPGAGPITISDDGLLHCDIDVGFDLSGRFWVVTQVDSYCETLYCDPGSSDTTLNCRGYDWIGEPFHFYAMLVVF